MRLVSIHTCSPGVTLAKTIYSSQGNVLVAAGVELTQRMLDRLLQFGIDRIYIKHKFSDDIIVDDIISEETRREAMSIIHSSFATFHDDTLWKKRVPDKHLGIRFSETITTVIDELKANPAAMNLLGTVCGVDHYVYAHSFHVTLYTLALGLKMGLSEKELTEIGIGGLLHDIGKLGVPLKILTKPGKLTEEEFEIMKSHTSIGFEILRARDDIPLLAAHCAFQHHERCDGSGYPRKLKDADIHPFAKIMAVCDVFDALTSNRVYRDAMLPHEAMEILYSGSGRLFSRELVEQFQSTIAIYPIGITVTLSTGEKGIVIRNNEGTPARPIVRVLTNEAGEELTVPFEVDLSNRLNIVISACETV